MMVMSVFSLVKDWFPWICWNPIIIPDFMEFIWFIPDFVHILCIFKLVDYVN